MCLLTHERYKIYQTGFSFGCLGHAPGVGLGGTEGVEGRQNFFPKFNQIWCVSYLHEWHMHQRHFGGPRPLGPWGGAKRSNTIKSKLQSQFQRFLNQTLCMGCFTYTPNPNRNRTETVTATELHRFVFGRPFTYEPNPWTKSKKISV